MLMHTCLVSTKDLEKIKLRQMKADVKRWIEFDNTKRYFFDNVIEKMREKQTIQLG
jgi:hypothetical protein